jgi:hypothetical protein
VAHFHLINLRLCCLERVLVGPPARAAWPGLKCDGHSVKVFVLRQPQNQTIAFQVSRLSHSFGIGVVAHLQSGRHRPLFKDVSEVLTKQCMHCVAVSEEPDHSRHADPEIEMKEIDETARDHLTGNNISRTIYASQTLGVIALCYRYSENWPPTGTLYQRGFVSGPLAAWPWSLARGATCSSS